MHLTEADPLDAAVTGTGGDQLVLVVRDPGRFAWVEAAASSLLARTTDAIVVDVGLPGWSPEQPVAGVVTTRGAGRVNYEAAVELLLAVT